MCCFAASIVDSGTCGDNLTWTLDSDGLLEISGTGSMKNYDIYFDTTLPWYYRKTEILSVKVKSGVTTIVNYAFNNCSSLTSIELPD